MIQDAVFPGSASRGGGGPATSTAERHGVFYTSARWTPEALAEVARRLGDEGGAALDRVTPQRRLAGWCETVERFRDPGSAESEALRLALARFCGLSRAGLEAGLEAVLGGVGGRAASRLFDQAGEPVDRGLVAVFLAGNLPALAVQPLLPAFALGRPVLLKSPSSEPLFAPAFVRALVRAVPEAEASIAVATWPGGTTELEDPVLSAAETTLVYGDRETIESVARRARSTCVAYGPRTSLAVVSRQAERRPTAMGLARDVALFDQRGCLSVQAVYTDGDPRELATELARALGEVALEWPPGPLDPSLAATVQQVRAEARLRGLFQPELGLAVGTVIVEPLPAFRPSPGLRTVRIHPVPDLERVLEALDGWRDRLQGAALAGETAWALESELTELGLSRCALPGDLQSPDALWHNGGMHPLRALGATPAL